VSYSIDVNVLLYASDRSSARHERARRFVATCAAGPEILCLAWPTPIGHLRQVLSNLSKCLVPAEQQFRD
jgi:uncharacterized protein